MEENRSLSELADLLKASYRKHATIERLFYPDYPLPIEQCYLDLALVEGKDFNTNKDNLKNISIETRDYFLHSYERIQHSERRLTPQQLLAECDTTPKRIYIEGAAGAGKTTLSQFIAYQWSKDQLAWKDYDFLFRIRLRDLTTANYPELKIDFIEFLEKECFRLGFSDSLTENEKNNLLHYLKSKTKKVIFILDGYDELSLENHALKTLWKDLIDSTYDFIITSRPGMQKFELKTNLNVAVLGFNDEQVKKFIQHFFDPQHTPDAQFQNSHLCLQIFRQDANLWSLAHTPIQLELLCSIWSEELLQISSTTLTYIYSLMLKQLLKRHEQKRLKKYENKEVILSDIDIDPLLESNTHYFEFLENVAYWGIENNKLILSSSMIEDAYNSLSVKPNNKPAFFESIKSLGFITRDSDGRRMEFIHLTFQEYFAARYIVRCLKLKQFPKFYLSLTELIAKKKYHRRYEIVWWFVAGLLKDKAALLKDYFYLLQSEPYDLVEAYQFNLQLYCLAECEFHLESEGKDKLLDKLATWIQQLLSNEDNNPMIGEFSLPTAIINQQPIITVLSDNINHNELNHSHLNLAKLSNLPEAILQLLVTLLNHECQKLQRSAEWILSNQTILPESILQELVKLLDHADENIQDFIVEVLSDYILLPETILQELAKLLNHADENIRDCAIEVLSNQIELPESILQELVKFLNHTDENIQDFIVGVLSDYILLPETILQELVKLLNHADEKTRDCAIEVLSNQTELPESILQELVKLMNHENENIRDFIVGCLSDQAQLSETIFQELVKLQNHADEKTRDYATEILSNYTSSLSEAELQELTKQLEYNNDGPQGYTTELSDQAQLPEAKLQELVKRLSHEDENIQDFIVGVLSNYTSLPETTLQELVKLLNHVDENSRGRATDILSNQAVLPESILQQLTKSLLDKNTQVYAAKILSKQTQLPESILQQLVKLLLDKNVEVHAAKVLSKQIQLPKNMLITICYGTNFTFILYYIKNIRITLLCSHLSRDQWDDSNSALLKLILLKCLEQKIALYFYDNQLYVGGESQGEFTVDCQKQIIQTLGQLFTEMTGIPATIKNNDKDYLHNLDQTTQLSGDSAMEDKNSSNTNMIRETIILKVKNLNSAIALIEDQLLQDKLTLLLDKCIKKATTLNNAALNNVVFCKQRDTHIQMLQEAAKEISTSDEFSEDDKSIALDQILPDLIFSFWCCRPFLKTETEDERTQHIAKEQQLFNEQKAIRTQPTFMPALSQLKEDRKAKQSRKPKLYFMYAWPIENYAQRESGIQEFLGYLRQDLHHAGIEAIFDREDNFSGNNLHHFMGEILQDHAIVLVFGTESFRHKWFGHKTALQVEGKLLKLKWLTDFSEGNIQPNQKTTIIPLVLTSIRETAIPEDLLPAKNPTVRALYNLSYKQIISSLLAVAYGITEPAVAKYINDTLDHIITIDPPNHTAPTHYSAIQPQTLFGRVNHPTRNNNNSLTHTTTSSFTSMEIEEESNTNVPK